MKKIAMIPARMGSQRLKQKNLAEIDGAPIIAWAIRKCQAADCFDDIYVNSEHDAFGEIAEQEGVKFHKRPEALANNVATSEQFVHEFLTSVPCDYLFQVHSIAPLLKAVEVRDFVDAMVDGGYDSMLSYVPEQIECALDGKPVNFTFAEKTNSQELRPVQRITWSITGWRSAPYIAAVEAGQTATYAGAIGFHPIGRLAGHIIKTAEDLEIARALWPLIEGTGSQ
jgi:CMP-N-acetylneuraminic acid synthetase